MSFTDATKKYLKELQHVGVVDAATIEALTTAAAQLDTKFQTSLLAEYHKTVRYINGLAPQQQDDSEEDDLLSPKDAYTGTD